MKQFTIGNAEKDLRLDQYLTRLMPGAGKSFLYKMLRKKNITRNGKKAEGNERLVPGDEICIYFADETFEKFCQTNPKTDSPIVRKAPKLSIPVIYEDEDVLIANKPAGILSQKADAGDYSLNDWFLDYLQSSATARVKGNANTETDTCATSASASLSFTPSVANRLDRNTSGMILCGKSLSGLRYLAEILRNRSLHKYYLAVVNGHVANAQEIDGYLIKDERTNQVTVFATQTHKTNSPQAAKKLEGDYIRTSYRPLAYMKEQDITLIEVLLITGKTHQIRAHLASIGHPLIGDPKYGNSRKNEYYRQKSGLKRQLLHCYRLAFAPEERSDIKVCGRSFTCAPPKDFIQITGEIYGNLEFPRS